MVAFLFLKHALLPYHRICGLLYASYVLLVGPRQSCVLRGLRGEVGLRGEGVVEGKNRLREERVAKRKKELVEQGLVEEGLVEQGLVEQGLVEQGLA